MTSSNHVLLISDEDNVRNRKTSTSSSIDSWDALGLDDESCVSKPHSSKSRPLSNQKVKVLPKYDPHSISISSADCAKNVLVQRSVQPQKNILFNVQQNAHHGDENQTTDTSRTQLIRNSRYRRKSPADQLIWTPGSSVPEESRIFAPSSQNLKSPRSVVPAAHLFKAEPITRTRVNRGTDSATTCQQNNNPKTNQASPMKLLPKGSQQVSPVDQKEKMKVKLMSVWNNVKYGWSVRTKPSFSSSSPISLLGVTYEAQGGGDHHRLHGESSYEKFLLDFSSRIWLTYRRDFPVLEDSTLSTDCGWGCMLRSGQMMLAQALMTHLLGRGWRTSGVPQTEKSERLHHMTVRWFGDLPDNLCPFSLHSLVTMGKSMGKKAGDWYGPASVAYILKQAMEAATLDNPSIDDLCVYVAQDCTVYKQDVIELCTQPSRIQKFQNCNVIRNSPLLPPYKRKPPVALSHPREEMIDWREAIEDENCQPNEQSNTKNVYQYVPRGFQSPPKSPLSRTWSNPFLASTSERASPLPSTGQSSFPSGTSLDCMDEPRDRWRSLVVLVPVRLGGDRLNKIYFPCIYRLLAHECSIGIIGGRPRHSLYFVGFQDDKLINLDPHYCQETVDVRVPNFPMDSFQCTDPRKIPISKMDPSCTIGFYFRTREDFEKFTETVEPLVSSGDGKSDYPVFIISSESSSTSYSNPSGLAYERNIDDPVFDNNSDFDGDDFVLI